MLVYLIVTNSFRDFYEQAFLFNTKVYYYYQGGFGINKIQPFFIGIGSFLSVITNCIVNILNNQNIQVSIVKLIIMICFFVKFFQMIYHKDYLKSIIIVLFASCAFARGIDNMHAIAVWFIVITIIVLFSDIRKEIVSSKIKLGLILFCAIIVISEYIQNVNKYLFIQKQPISAVEQEVFEKTLEGEEIFCDADACQMIYLIYKDRLPANRLTFFLPWYMDWYETETLETLKKNDSRIVIFNEDKSKVFKETFNAPADSYGELQRYINNHYDKSENSQIIWYKN